MRHPSRTRSSPASTWRICGCWARAARRVTTSVLASMRYAGGITSRQSSSPIALIDDELNCHLRKSRNLREKSRSSYTRRRAAPPRRRYDMRMSYNSNSHQHQEVAPCR